VSAASVSRLRVRYAETDQMGVAWHGSYFAWFEVGRTDLLRERGMTYRELEEQDLFLPVIEARASYSRPARYDDLLEIRTRIALHSGARVSFEYEVHTEGHASALATGFTAHAAIDGRGKPRRLPAELRRLLS
jgi:acyl-CoA thioester hydrolase